MSVARKQYKNIDVVGRQRFLINIVENNDFKQFSLQTLLYGDENEENSSQKIQPDDYEEQHYIPLDNLPDYIAWVLKGLRVLANRQKKEK